MRKIILLISSVLLLGLCIFFNINNLKSFNALNLLAFISLILAVIFVSFSISFIVVVHYKKISDNYKKRLDHWNKISYHVNKVSDQIINEVPVGIVVFEEDFIIRWSNDFFKQMFKEETLGNRITTIIPEFKTAVDDNKKSFIISIENRKCDILYMKDNNCAYIFDVTTREESVDKYKNNILAIGMIHFDYLEEAISNLGVSEQASLKAQYMSAISSWCAKYTSLLRPFSEDRMIIITTRERLLAMISGKFDILETVRSISMYNNLKVSASIGFSSYETNASDNNDNALAAIDLAEKRGGDQVVVNIEGESIKYFGAKVQKIAAQSMVNVRVAANSIKEAISAASNVFVMGHMYSDLDCLGSGILVDKLCKTLKKDCYIVADEERLERLTVTVLNKLVEENDPVKKDIVSTKTALDLINENSLLIIVDTQERNIVHSPELLDKIKKIVVIDHHRSDVAAISGLYNYVETTGSSVIELLLELSSFFDKKLDITSTEATLLYAGILIDTQDLTNKTTARTFEALSQLLSYDGNIDSAKKWLRKDVETIKIINSALSIAKIYKEKYCIITVDEIMDQVVISQIADSGLSIRNIEASFAIAKIAPNTIKVSARSYGVINVQSIIESLGLGGGGHFTAAAFVVENKTVIEIEDLIKFHISLLYQDEGESKMKIILLENIKGRGNIEDIIEVNNGYGQFLVSSKKALLATKENLSILSEKQRKANEEEERQLDLANRIKNDINGKNIVINLNVGENGKAFGSITKSKIIDAFYEQHTIKLDSKKIELSNEISSVGIYQCVVTIYKNIKATFDIQAVSK
ncbi:MAG: 50S ribosomal protein L9 [Acholeplasmatales bacterium]|jgi:ribosomal protein L9|nr:50S ribosomal protein L9 [Acholeplasmatales bacterium]